MFIILIMNFNLSILFCFLKHPLSMGLILLLQTLNISLITGFLHMNFWFSYILFLIMVGGMLVLFIYMTSVASNEKFKFSTYLMMMFMIIMLMMIIFMIYYDTLLINYMNFNSMMNYKFEFSLMKFLNFPSNLILFMMIIYLFITLVAVVKITDFLSGPLRQN